MYTVQKSQPFLGALDDICQVLSANLPQILGMNIIQQEFETTDRCDGLELGFIPFLLTESDRSCGIRIEDSS